ncbi:hypothetical protein IP88_03140 [alpha proteobacterium AAP81b]|nr:hypothetical protein IP88_03140 [alpha proteobacterium AAP81b]
MLLLAWPLLPEKPTRRPLLIAVALLCGVQQGWRSGSAFTRWHRASPPMIRVRDGKKEGASGGQA